jgi:hypothetical protein
MLSNNNNWNQSEAGTDPATLNSVFSAVGAFSLRTTNGDAAVVNALAPGSYTLQAAPASLLIQPGGNFSPSSTGRVLIEVYEVP